MRPLLYTYPSFWNVACGDSEELKAWSLWLAAYGPNDGKRHPAPKVGPWKAPVVQQFTSVGVVPGISGQVDLNYAASLRPILAEPEKKRKPKKSEKAKALPGPSPKPRWYWNAVKELKRRRAAGEPVLGKHLPGPIPKPRWFWSAVKEQDRRATETGK